MNGNLTIFSTNIFTNGNQLKVFGNNGFTLSFSSGTNIQQAGSLSINQNSTVIFNSAHSYAGDTFVNAGKLQFASGGSANGSIIRIGDTTGTVGAEFDLTVATGGQSVGNTIVSRPGSAGYGTRLIDSQNTSGTNALTGVIALDAALTLKQAAGGTLNLTGSFADVKQQVLTVNAAGSVNFSKPLNSSFTAGGSLVKQGNGTLILSNTSNNYTGTLNSTLNPNGTQIAAGTLAIAADTSLGLAPSSAYNNVQFTGTGTLRSDATISLNANRNISVASGATANFDSNGNTFTINGIVNGSGGAVTKTGGGSLVLAGNNTYTGETTVNQGTVLVSGSISGTTQVNVTGGTLQLGASNVVNNSAAVNFAGGTLATGGFDEGSDSVVGLGSFILSANSTLDFGSGTGSQLLFAGVGAHSGGVLAIENWSGINGVAGGASADRLMFVGLASSFTNFYAQNDVSFNGNSGYVAIQFGPSRFEIVAVPEPSSSALLGGAALLGLVRFRERRRLMGLGAKRA